MFFATFTGACVRATHAKQEIMVLSAVLEHLMTFYTAFREGVIQEIAVFQLQKSEDNAVNREASL